MQQEIAKIVLYLILKLFFIKNFKMNDCSNFYIEKSGVWPIQSDPILVYGWYTEESIHHCVEKATKTVPLFIFMSQKEVLHLLSAKVNFVLIVPLDCLRFIYRVIQGQQKLLKALHYWRGRTQVHLMDVTKPERNGIRGTLAVIKTI